MPHRKLLTPVRTSGLRRLSERNPASSVGLAALDIDHHLVQVALGILENEINFETRGETLENSIRFLIDYTDQHFTREESLMRGIGYPDLDGHKSSHDIMRAWMDASLPEIGSVRNPHYDDDVVAYLYDWWDTHAGKEDKGYADFIKERLSEAQRIAARLPPIDVPAYLTACAPFEIR
ncbi:MAG: hemerythrin domain-containing protein [Rhodospirillales bacterium]|nr:hemerythrin domain-containing protein [Rhodospirillales bacterium]